MSILRKNINFVIMKPKLHIVSFQNPYPPTYGGVIDVYYKLKALKNAGVYVILHTYYYKDRVAEMDNLRDVADEIYFYKRKRGLLKQLSLLPYIVNTRKDKQLLENLLKTDAPILYEGLHTCYTLSDEQLKSRLKIVRMHNVEHDYYMGLSRASNSLYKKLFYYLEAWRLKRFEKRLSRAQYVMAISENDRDYFSRKYPLVNTMLLPCFYDDEPPCRKPGKGDYILYHGNLAVDENVNAAMWILQNIVSRLPEYKFVFAGSNPNERLSNETEKHQNVSLVTNPSQAEIEDLLIDAHINLLITFQPTGVKLKLLNALCKGGYVVANSLMVSGSGVAPLCEVVDKDDDIVEKIRTLMDSEFGGRRDNLGAIYSNRINIEKILELL